MRENLGKVGVGERMSIKFISWKESQIKKNEANKQKHHHPQKF